MANEFDPNVLWQAMMNYQSPTGPSYDEDVLSDQGKYLTQLSKWGNATTDLDTLTSMGALSPGAYDPMTTFEPVDAPGYRLLQSYKQGTPYQQYVAKQREVGKKNALEIYTDLQKLVADPGDDPFAQQVIASMPKQMVENFTGTGGNRVSTGWQQIDAPDLKAVQDDLQKLESTIMSDPEYTVGPDGQPVTAKTEDSAAMKAWHDAGYVSDPTATYDPWSFAPAGEQERFKGTTKNFADALMARGVGDVHYKRALAEEKAATDAIARYKAMGERDMTAVEPTPAALRGGQPEERRGGIAGFLDDLPGDSGIADWMNRDRGPDTSRDKVPQRGGIADDMARIAEHPGKSIFGFLGELPGKVSKIPGMIDRSTESAAGAADTGLGNTLEERFSGNAPLFSATGSVSGTSDFRIPDLLTGNQGGIPQSPLAGLPGLGGGPLAPGANAGGGDGTMTGAPNVGPAWMHKKAPAAFDSNTLNKVLTDAAMKKYRDQLLQARGQSVIESTNKFKNREADRDAAHAYDYAKRQQAARVALVSQLAAAGRSPARDEVNARNALLGRMGG